jgi:hypothetical protein
MQAKDQNSTGDRNNMHHTAAIADEYSKHSDALHHVRTAGSIVMSPELFEKLYLSPQNAVKGDLRRTLGNPTPMQVP